jgi:cold shock CspA family protein
MTENSNADAPIRITGEVVWFDDQKGFGFLRASGLNVEVFCHYSHIIMPEPRRGDRKLRRTLHADQRVEFELNKRDGKVQAENIRPLED